MPNIDPLPRQAAPDFEDVFQAMEDALGYVPNSFFTMARHPAILTAVGRLMDAFWYSDTVDEPTRRLVTFAYSHFAGSPYSAAHCACGATELGLANEKIQAINDYETAPVYSADERALLRLCWHSAQSPSQVTADHVDDVKSRYGEDVTAFLAGLVSCMAFLNRWNEICGTTLEDIPQKYAEVHLANVGWRDPA